MQHGAVPRILRLLLTVTALLPSPVALARPNLSGLRLVRDGGLRRREPHLVRARRGRGLPVPRLRRRPRPVETTVPRCPAYEGTMSYEPSYLPNFGASATSTAAATASGAAAKTGSAASGESTATATQGKAETGAQTTSADRIVATAPQLATTQTLMSSSFSLSSSSSPNPEDFPLPSESSLSSAGSSGIEEATMAPGATTSSSASRAAAAAVTTAGANALRIGVGAAGFLAGVIVGQVPVTGHKV
ncbi:hypothetical protein DL764_001700 [Monosporascus ibericus]|uniref:Uncharacterized protein n=1 Tax=Monosporascus ibericus TaxID=155417 RepID=A0A4V1XC77_9PEZI|nr:hypothetical protein DL764_001700 [Monosporascus ibericus]